VIATDERKKRIAVFLLFFTALFPFTETFNLILFKLNIFLF
jgi:hypothetical protein